MKFYTDFVAMTDKQYEHCTLEEKLSVYVQHYPSVVVPLLKELVNEMNRSHALFRRLKEEEIEALEQRLKELRE